MPLVGTFSIHFVPVRIPGANFDLFLTPLLEEFWKSQGGVRSSLKTALALRLSEPVANISPLNENAPPGGDEPFFFGYFSPRIRIFGNGKHVTS